MEGQEDSQSTIRGATLQWTNSGRRGVSLQERPNVVVHGSNINIQRNETLEEEVSDDGGRTICLNINL